MTSSPASVLARVALVFLCSACSLAPDYTAPETPVPPAYKETDAAFHDWVEAQPGRTDQSGASWRVFGDPTLNRLEDEVTSANLTLQIAVAQYDQARAAARGARAAYFPTITAATGAERERNSRTLANNSPVNQYNNFSAGADLSYEVDIWGRVRNVVDANASQAEASADDLAGVALSLHAEMAADYFTLRGDDQAIRILDKTVAADQKALDLTRQRYTGGLAAEFDVDQAETQLNNAKTAATDMRLQRAQLEHAIAILTGRPPAAFTLPPATAPQKLPRITTGLPSVLLQRRPDIAAAERRVAAANAEIGVARAAWFPTFNLMAMFGAESASAGQWLTAPSQFWSFGPSAAMPLFEGGAISALNEQARAAYAEQVAAYRQTVLTAYGEVEDNLAALHRLAEESRTQSAASAAADRALAQANNLYHGGNATYLDVVVAEDNALQAQLAAVTIAVRRQVASVQLIKALGGGWTRP